MGTEAKQQSDWFLVLAIVGAAGFVLAALALQHILWLAFAGSPRPAWVAPLRIVIVGAPVWLPLGVLLLRRGKSRLPAWRAFHAIALAVWFALALFLVVIVGDQLVSYAQWRVFDSELWRGESVAAPGQAPLRRMMVHDLIASRRLDGRSRDQVHALLGTSNRRVHLSPDPSEGSWDETYPVGPSGWIMYRWLGIRFDADGRVAEYALLWDD